MFIIFTLINILFIFNIYTNCENTDNSIIKNNNERKSQFIIDNVMQSGCNFCKEQNNSKSKTIDIFYSVISQSFNFSSTILTIPVIFSSKKHLNSSFISNPNGTITAINTGFYQAYYSIIYEDQSLTTPIWLGLSIFDSDSNLPLSLVKQFYYGTSSSDYKEVGDNHIIQVNTNQNIQLNIISTSSSSFTFNLTSQLVSGGYNAILILKQI
jgi:hypothetical protein